MVKYPLQKSILVIAVLLFGAILAGEAQAQQVVTGTTGEGAQYEFWVPDNWNNDLVVWVHGIIDPVLPVDLLPDTTQGMKGLRDGWLARGYAFAYSTYSENGYAFKDGMQRTHQLRGLFVSQFGKPDRTFLYGISMGAGIAVALLEKFPKQYDGAVCEAGIVGGNLPEVQYLANGRVLYDVFFSSGAFGAFPYQLPGDAGHPVALPFNPGSPAFNGVLGNLAAGGALLIDYALTAQIPFANAAEAFSGAMNVIGFNVLFAEELLSRTHNRVPFDNTQTVYHDPLNSDFDSLINSLADRFPPSRDAANYLDKYFTPTGMISAPVYTIHATRDPIVPIWHEALFAGKVAAAGRSEFLAQKSYDRWGHSGITSQERLEAFDALITWIATGVKPAP
jgi:alpha-beta hydrolase superfamily lysophospholipase